MKKMNPLDSSEIVDKNQPQELSSANITYSSNNFKKVVHELITSKKNTWIADNNLITFSTVINSNEWYEYHNGFIVNHFELVENKQLNEVIIYSSKMKLYYKIGPDSLSFSRSLEDNYVPLYNGFWLTNNGKYE